MCCILTLRISQIPLVIAVNLFFIVSLYSATCIIKLTKVSTNMPLCMRKDGRWGNKRIPVTSNRALLTMLLKLFILYNVIGRNGFSHHVPTVVMDR